MTQVQSPPEMPHKSRRTLISPQECEIVRGSPNQLEIHLDSPALAPEHPSCPSYTKSGFTSLRQLRDSLRKASQVYRNTNFSTEIRGKLNSPHNVSRRELIPRILLNSKANFPQAPQEEPSLSNKYVRGTPSLLPQVEWIPRFPDLK